MAEVSNDDLPPHIPHITEELREFVRKQCIQLAVMEKLMGTPERGKAVARFMKTAMAEFLGFNLAERTLIIQFINETNSAVQSAMESIGQCKPLDELEPDLKRLLVTSASLAKEVCKKENE